MAGHQVTEESVRAGVAAAVGGQVVAVERLPGSVANQDFLVRLADQTLLVVKAGPAAELAAEAWACRRLAVAGVPVPQVVALDLQASAFGLPTLVLSFVAGAASEDLRVAHQAGQRIRQVHAEELPGWGPLVLDFSAGQVAARGRYGSWGEAVLAELSGIPELVEAGVLGAGLASTARACILDVDLMDYSGPGVLLHRDLKPAHLFAVDDGDGPRLAAIIDWGDAGVGDPIGDLARLSMAGPAITAAFLAGYGGPATAGLLDRLARYRILWNIRALSYEYRAGGDWFDTYRSRIADDTRRLRADRVD